jgi:hypothetical protein
MCSAFSGRGNGSAAGDDEIELAQSQRVEDHVDLNDLLAPGREAECGAWCSASDGPDSTGRFDNEGGQRGYGAFGELLRNGRRAANLCQGTDLDGGGVGAEYDAGVEYREQRGEVTVAGGGEEGLDQLGLAGEVGAGHRVGGLHSLPGAAGELLRGVRGAAQYRGDLLEGDGEAARHYTEQELAALVLWIATANLFNRLNATTSRRC